MKSGPRKTIEIVLGACAFAVVVGAGLPAVHVGIAHAGPTLPAYSTTPPPSPSPPPTSPGPVYNQEPDYNPGADGGGGGGGGG